MSELMREKKGQPSTEGNAYSTAGAIPDSYAAFKAIALAHLKKYYNNNKKLHLLAMGSATRHSADNLTLLFNFYSTCKHFALQEYITLDCLAICPLSQWTAFNDAYGQKIANILPCPQVIHENSASLSPIKSNGNYRVWTGFEDSFLEKNILTLVKTFLQDYDGLINVSESIASNSRLRFIVNQSKKETCIQSLVEYNPANIYAEKTIPVKLAYNENIIKFCSAIDYTKNLNIKKENNTSFSSTDDECRDLFELTLYRSVMSSIFTKSDINTISALIDIYPDWQCEENNFVTLALSDDSLASLKFLYDLNPERFQKQMQRRHQLNHMTPVFVAAATDNVQAFDYLNSKMPDMGSKKIAAFHQESIEHAATFNAKNILKTLCALHKKKLWFKSLAEKLIAEKLSHYNPCQEITTTLLGAYFQKECVNQKDLMHFMLIIKRIDLISQYILRTPQSVNIIIAQEGCFANKSFIELALQECVPKDEDKYHYIKLWFPVIKDLFDVKGYNEERLIYFLIKEKNNPEGQKALIEKLINQYESNQNSMYLRLLKRLSKRKKEVMSKDHALNMMLLLIFLKNKNITRDFFLSEKKRMIQEREPGQFMWLMQHIDQVVNDG